MDGATHLRRALLRVIAAIVIAAIAIACGPGSDGGRSDAGQAPEPDGGRAAPRVVALAPSLAELVVEIGGADHLVARTDFDTHPALVGLPSIGGGLDPSMEALVGLGVEVVLMTAGRDAPALGEQLGGLGIRAVSFSTETIADIHESSRVLGELLELRAEADSVSRAIDAGLAEVRRSVDGFERVSVMYVVWWDPPMTAGPATFIDELIGIAGGRNVFGDVELPWPTVGFESIVARAPEVVLWPQGEITVDNVDQLQGTPGWRDVGAVQAGRVELVDGNLFNRPGPGVVEAARVLARVLHPELR
jgi:iron complex transport system substrate-binding protein